MTDEPVRHRFYGDLARWWPLISPPEDYEEEATFAARVLGSASIPVREVLELGSGGGHNAVHLKSSFVMTLVDLSNEMLEMSRQLNPECEHQQGDMRTVRLGRQFDAVFIHDAIDYMTTESDLRQAIDTAFLHCRPGGIAVLFPITRARRSSRRAISAAATRPMDAACASSTGRGIRMLTTRGRSPSTPSCFANPTVQSTSSTRSTGAASSVATSGSGSSPTQASNPTSSSRRRPSTGRPAISSWGAELLCRSGQLFLLTASSIRAMTSGVSNSKTSRAAKFSVT